MYLTMENAAQQDAPYVDERQIVASLWEQVEDLVSGGPGLTAASLRELKDALPPLGDMTREALPKLAELHLSSASSMAHAIKLLVPGAFVNNNNKDGGGNSTSLSPNWQALCKEGEGVMSMVSSLIDLQLFHLLRAQAITAEMRFRIARRQLEGKQAAGAGAGVTTHKPCLCPTSDCCHCATLTK